MDCHSFEVEVLDGQVGTNGINKTSNSSLVKNVLFEIEVLK